MIKKTENPVEALKEAPGELIPEVKAKPVVSMTLEEKVLNFINKHPNGVKILDMEEPLHERRMKIGFITKNLFEDGKVLKREDVYFPKKLQ